MSRIDPEAFEKLEKLIQNDAISNKDSSSPRSPKQNKKS